MKDEEQHYLEVGSDDVPRRARADAAQPESRRPKGFPEIPREAGERPGKPDAASSLRIGYDDTQTLVGIDYRGDRVASNWRSVGERLGGIMWHIIIVLAIIVWLLYQLITCNRAPIHIINQ